MANQKLQFHLFCVDFGWFGVRFNELEMLQNALNLLVSGLVSVVIAFLFWSKDDYKKAGDFWNGKGIGIFLLTFGILSALIAARSN